jgi:hypothetical protein
MAWQRVERQSTINSLLTVIEKQGPMTYIEAEKFIMNLHMLSRLTAERYIQDLLFQGKLILEKDILKKPGVSKK